MKFGINTFIWSLNYDDAVEQVLPLIRENGFDGIEVAVFRAAELPAQRIRRATEEQGLECNTCSVLVDGMSLISGDASVRRKTIHHLKDLIAATASVNARILAGPLYCPVGFLPGRRRTSDEWKWAVEGFQSLGDTLTQHHVTLAIEPLNRFETFFLNIAADAARLAEEIDHPNIGILFDTFHANIEEKDIAAGYRTVGKHLKHVHTCENDRGIPGSGHVEWSSVFHALDDLQYDGWLTIESFGFAIGELSAAAAIWRDIETTPASIAFEGIRFLKENVGRRKGRVDEQ
ncbi:MAG TPA: sugar phosphate isomerase/epimerase family protein [Bryobacteraceae bacterium]|nr:sugar phosphate isomerase/epimerase family protein [Bryobacteraceae bacterium]